MRASSSFRWGVGGGDVIRGNSKCPGLSNDMLGRLRLQDGKDDRGSLKMQAPQLSFAFDLQCSCRSSRLLAPAPAVAATPNRSDPGTLLDPLPPIMNPQVGYFVPYVCYSFLCNSAVVPATYLGVTGLLASAVICMTLCERFQVPEYR